MLHAWLVAPTVPHTVSAPWVQDWDVQGFAARQSESANTDPSYFRHWTVRVWVPLAFLVHEAVRVWVPPPQVTEHVPQAEYHQVPVSPEHVHQVQDDQAFATQEVPFQEYPALQAFATFDSDPLVATAPFEHVKLCWYVCVPLAMATVVVGLEVAP